jgi:aminoglycoside phosphotransferase (APT) family kinase protein
MNAIDQIKSWLGEEAVVQPLGVGLINQSYKVGAEAGCVLVQRINPAIFTDPEALEHNYRAIGAHLTASGYRLAWPHLLKQQRLDASTWRMLTWVNNSLCLEHVVSEEQIVRAAHAVAHFYQKADGLTQSQLKPVLPRFTDVGFRLEAYNRVRTLAKEGLETELCRWIEGHRNDCLYFENLPQQLIHGDLKVSNFLFDQKGQQVLALVDWDTAMWSSRLYDFGDMARSFTATCYEGRLSHHMFNNRYYQVLKTAWIDMPAQILSDFEKSLLDQAARTVIFVQAVRFFTDHLAGDVYYQVQYRGENLHKAHQKYVLWMALGAIIK